MYMLNRNKTLHVEFAWQDNRSPVHFSGLGLKKERREHGNKTSHSRLCHPLD